MKVFFYLVPRETATKVDAFAGDNGEPLLKTKIGNKTGNVYRVLTSGSTGRLKTGLDIMVDNPYKSLDKEQVKSGFEPVIFNKEKVKLQHILEYKHGVPVDFYTDMPITNEVYTKELLARNKEIPFFQRGEFKVKLSDSGLMLDTDNHMDELKYYFLKASNKCAPSGEKANPSIHEFYIGAENESEEKLFSKTELIDKATALLVTGVISDDYKIKISKVLGLTKKEVNAKKAHMALRNYVVEKHKNQLERVKEFIELVEGLSEPKNKERLEAKALLEDLISYRVVTSASDIYEWKSKGINIGMNKAAALDYLLSPHKQDEQEELIRELESKK
jgi:hypothetical protein